jgi:uncharacterized OsmC-like protein
MASDEIADEMDESTIYGPKYGHFEMTSGSAYKTIGAVHADGRESHEIIFDEPDPRGDDDHPSPVMYLFASLVGCQMAVLCAALEKARIEDFRIKADAESERSLDEVAEEMPDGTAKRIEHIDIDLTLEVPKEYEDRAQRCLDVYDTGCIVGQSLRAGIDYTPETSLETK